jgi:hypothetical protein
MSEAEPTLTELLTAVNAAIYALLTRRVESYTVGGASYKYHDLDKLRAWRNELLAASRPSGSLKRLADFRS